MNWLELNKCSTCHIYTHNKIIFSYNCSSLSKSLVCLYFMVMYTWYRHACTESACAFLLIGVISDDKIWCEMCFTSVFKRLYLLLSLWSNCPQNLKCYSQFRRGWQHWRGKEEHDSTLSAFLSFCFTRCQEVYVPLVRFLCIICLFIVSLYVYNSVFNRP